MKALFESIDFFAHKINFNYEKKSFYHSFFGIGLTFALYIVMIQFVIYFSWDFMTKTNPRVIYKETEFEGNITMNIQEIFQHQSFLVNFDTNETENKFKYTNSSYISIPSDLIGHFYVKHYRNGNFLNIYLFTFPIYLQKEFDFDKDLTKYRVFCGVGENKTIKVLYQNSTIFNEIKLTLKAEDTLEYGYNVNSLIMELLVSNKTENVLIRFQNLLINNIVNVNSESFFKKYSEPIISKPKINQGEKTLISEVLTTNFGVVSLRDDYGFIFSEEKIKNTIKKNYDSIQIMEMDKSIPVLKIKIDKITKHYDRIFRKLQNVFSDLGGIMSSLILVGNIIIVQFNKKKFDYDLINKVFIIETDENEIEINPNSKFILKKILEKSIRNFKNTDMNSSRIPIKSFIKIDIKKTNNDVPANLQSIITHDMNMGSLSVGENSSSPNENNKILSNLKVEEREKINSLNELKPIEKSNNDNKYEDSDSNLKKFYEKYSNGTLFKKPLKYTKKEFFKSFLFCSKLKGEEFIKKERLFTLAQDKIYEYMDVINYVHLFEKYDKLISMIFNESQAFSFNFVQNKKLNDLKENKKFDIKSIRSTIDYFRVNIKDSKMSDTDQRLFNSFYPCFSKLI